MTWKDCFPMRHLVSLFTREWIEIIRLTAFFPAVFVSLFTREWIEIQHSQPCESQPDSLPLYEGVD